MSDFYTDSITRTAAKGQASVVAAVQAENVQLRSAIIQFRNEPKLARAISIRATEGYRAMEHAAFPAVDPGTSALEALITKAGEVMRERCLEAGVLRNYKGAIVSRLAGEGRDRAIRALPGVKLEDLQG